MPSVWRREAFLFLVVVGVSTAIGRAFDSPEQGLLLGLLAQILLSFQRLRLFHRWIEKGDLTVTPPQYAGIWGDLCDRLQGADRKRRAEIESLRESLHLVRDVLSVLKDGVVRLNRANQLEWCNDSAEKMLGLRFPQDGGQPLVNFVRNLEFAAYLRRGEYAAPLEIGSPGDEDRLLEIYIGLVGDHSKLVFVRDVTAVRRLEKIRQEFVANISHELRTPLTVISGYLDTLQDLFSGDPAVLERVLAQMQQQSIRMENLLEDLMLLSQLEATGASQPGEEEMIGVRALLESLCENAQATCGGNREILLECPPGYRFRARRIQLESVFSNLIFNAVRYTQAGGHIKIRFDLQDKEAIFSVIDDGIGIDPAHISRLTERFYRVEKSRSVASGGTGLGLAIVKHALKHLDGRLDIQSRPGIGSTFSCRFDADRVDASEDFSTRAN